MAELDVFLVEDIERRQADVGDFLLTERITGRGAVSCDGTFAVGAVADAPPAIAKDTPATPNTGKVVLRRFRFEACFACAIVEPSYACEQMSGMDDRSTFRALCLAWRPVLVISLASASVKISDHHGGAPATSV